VVSVEQVRFVAITYLFLSTLMQLPRTSRGTISRGRTWGRANNAYRVCVEANLCIFLGKSANRSPLG